MGVLEPRDQPSLGLEAADELGLVDELGTDHLDRHLPAHRRLVGAVDDAEVALADLLPQLVTPHRPAESARRHRRRQPVEPNDGNS